MDAFYRVIVLAVLVLVRDRNTVATDPQHRLLLEVAVQALADANLTRAELRGRRVGIFIGVSVVEYGLAALRTAAEGIRAKCADLAKLG